MVEKTAVELGDVQKTLLLPLWGRAEESRKRNPLLVDRNAVAIVEQIDFDFASLAKRLSELTRIAWIMRSLCTDEVISGFLFRYPRATIVNLGCGLDTTFDRVDNGTLTWYDLDLPDVIQLRRRFIQETDRSKCIASSLLDLGWMNSIEVKEKALFVAAGVFYYFEEQEVRDFLLRLADNFSGSQFLMDVSSPYGVKAANKMVIKRGGLDERSFLKWGLEAPETLLSWDKRIRLLNVYFYFGERAKHLGLRVRLLGWLSDLLKIQYMVHLEMSK
jgi:O-methyltransferase involved in polyketide biosynthesis